MKKKVSISKIVLLRLLLLTLVFGGAVLYDACHDEESVKVVQSQQNTSGSNLDIAHLYFFNPVSSFKLLDRADKLLSRILFSASPDKFLSMYHNCEAYYVLKKESDKDRQPFHLMAHHLKYTSYHYSSPDDYPSFS